MTGFIAKTADGSQAQAIRILSVASATTFVVQKTAPRVDNSVAKAFETNNKLSAPTWNPSDMSTYDATFTVYFEQQFNYAAS